MRLQVTEQRVADARAALQAGDASEAVAEYRAALEDAPEVAGLRLELAELLAGRGDKTGAPSRSWRAIPPRTARCCCGWASCSRA